MYTKHCARKQGDNSPCFGIAIVDMILNFNLALQGQAGYYLRSNDCRAAPKMANDRMAEDRHQVQGSPPNLVARIYLGA